MDLSDIILGFATFFGTYYVKQLSMSINEITYSIRDLNQKMAIIIERTETHGHEIQILREKHDNIASDVAHIKAHIER